MDYARLFAKILTPVVLPFFKLHVKWKHYKERKYIQNNIIRLKKQNGTYLEEGVFNKVTNLGSVESNVKKLSATVQEHKEDLEGFVPSEVIDLAAGDSRTLYGLSWPPLQAVNDPFTSLKRPPILPPGKLFEWEPTPPVIKPAEIPADLADKLEMALTGHVKNKSRKKKANNG